MKDASLSLYKAVRTALVGDATINGLVADRVVSDWESKLEFPCVRMSIPNVAHFEAQSHEGSEEGSDTVFNVHVFTRESGQDQVSTLAAQIREVLQDADLAVDDADLWWIEFVSVVPARNPEDPGIQSLVVSFRAFTTA